MICNTNKLFQPLYLPSKASDFGFVAADRQHGCHRMFDQFRGSLFSRTRTSFSPIGLVALESGGSRSRRRLWDLWKIEKMFLIRACKRTKKLNFEIAHFLSVYSFNHKLKCQQLYLQFLLNSRRAKKLWRSKWNSARTKPSRFRSVKFVHIECCEYHDNGGIKRWSINNAYLIPLYVYLT